MEIPQALASLPPSSAHQRLGWPEYRYLQNIHFCPSPFGEGSEADGSKVPTFLMGTSLPPVTSGPQGRLSGCPGSGRRYLLRGGLEPWEGSMELSACCGHLSLLRFPGHKQAVSSRGGMNLINVFSFIPALIKTPKQNRKQGDLGPINILKLYR